MPVALIVDHFEKKVLTTAEETEDGAAPDKHRLDRGSLHSGGTLRHTAKVETWNWCHLFIHTLICCPEAHSL